MKEAKYGRDGLTFLTFSCEKPAVHEMEVRQAIAWCLDRDALTTEYCGESGKRVDGYFGTGQWEYQLVKQEINHPAQMDDPSDLHREGDQKVTNEAWKTLTLDNLTAYHVDTIKANALLDKAGWTLNAEGGAYDGSKGGVRCKEIDGEIVPLELKMIYPEGSHIFDNLKKHFTTSLGRCGIVLEAEAVPMNDLLREYYRETERTADMIYLGTNFHVMTDPSVELSLDGSVNHERWNSTYSDDEDLYWRAVSMRQTDPQDVYDYVTKWVAFQERYNEVLPAIPVYSNMYSDFWRPELTGYTLSNHNTWTQAILKAAFAK